jgi:hypothetical protein
MKSRRTLSVFALCVLSISAPGCGGGGLQENHVPVAGVVTLDGQPLEGAEINFLHEKHPVGMITGPGGKYNIPTGVVPGTYKVTVSKQEGLEDVPEGVAVAPMPGGTKENPETLPPHFSNPRLTKLQITVPEEGTQAANLDLRTK